ncbi:LRR domain containing protein [Trema orientale]|uniref:LRR domain containing protein n=1 Tax=Trema orientale TaxID=63057 RepID=A0A2P5C055_TREOI|nr:LRR domain containing protein [Trema orientale]
MAVLERLPNLRLLQLLFDSYCGSKLVCSAGGFPKLETLQLCYLNSLEEWQIEKDAMPSLKRLNLAYIPQLRMIPERLQFVTTIRRLNGGFLALLGFVFLDFTFMWFCSTAAQLVATTVGRGLHQGGFAPMLIVDAAPGAWPSHPVPV